MSISSIFEYTQSTSYCISVLRAIDGLDDEQPSSFSLLLLPFTLSHRRPYVLLKVPVKEQQKLIYQPLIILPYCCFFVEFIYLCLVLFWTHPAIWHGVFQDRHPVMSSPVIQKGPISPCRYFINAFCTKWSSREATLPPSSPKTPQIEHVLPPPSLSVWAFPSPAQMPIESALNLS